MMRLQAEDTLKLKTIKTMAPVSLYTTIDNVALDAAQPYIYLLALAVALVAAASFGLAAACYISLSICLAKSKQQAATATYTQTFARLLHIHHPSDQIRSGRGVASQ
jgi:inactivated superfamily I helicase